MNFTLLKKETLIFKLIYLVFFLFLSTTFVFSQTMTFNSGPSEPGFTFDGWDGTGGILFPANACFGCPTQITKTTLTWDVISFQTRQFTGANNDTWTATSDKGNSYSFIPNQNGPNWVTHTLNWTGIKWLKITLTSFGGNGLTNHTFDFDNVVYLPNNTPPCIISLDGISNNPASCCQNNGFILVTPASCTCIGSLEYTINNGATWQNTFDFFNLPPGGGYNVKIRDSGNTSCMASYIGNPVTVLNTPDNTNPVAMCKNITAQLNSAGTVSITGAQIDNGSTDNCQLTFSVTPSTFTCANIGANTVVFKATDQCGHTATCTSIVTVQNQNVPIALCKNISLPLNSSGTASIIPSDVNNGSSAVCGIQGMSVSPNTFTCANVGTNSVTFTVTGNNGLTSTCIAIVTVQDNTPPTAICQNTTKQLDVNGMASIAPAEVNNGSNDACGIQSLSVSPNSFTCANIGNNTVTLTVTDNNGKVSTCTSIVTIKALTLGNLVYKDVNKNGVFDAGDTGIDGVTVRLYLDDGDGVLTGADGAAIATTTTAGGGLYSFADICSGNYIVEIPISNFNIGGALYDNGLGASFLSSPIGGASDPDNDVNNDDNGDPVAGFGIASQAITLSFGGEPVNDGDTDNNTNLSLDFGFKIPTTVSINDITQAEGTGGSTTAFNFTVTRSDNLGAFDLTVNTSDGTAVSPSDFTAISAGTVSFTAGGSLTATVTVLANHDNIVESNESFNVLLSGPPSGVVITDGTGIGTISNDDAAVVTLSGGTTKSEGNAGSIAYVFTANLNNPVQGGFSVAYSTNNGTATTADNDYADNDGSLNFTGTAGESHDITVSVNGDNKVELDETFTENLNTINGAPVGVTIAGSPQTGTITNDDAAVISLAGNLSGSEATTPQAYSVTLSNPVDVPVTVLFNTSNGTATTADNDYNGIVNQTVSFSAGTTTSQTVNVTINNDTKVEDNEIYNVAIGTLAASGRNVSLGTTNGTGTINNDDAATLSLSGGIAQNEGNSGTTSFNFTATLSNAVQGGFTVAYTSNDGTATTVDNDYIDNDASLNFTGNASETKTITVLVNGDHKVEANEIFNVALGIVSASTPVQLAAITELGSPQTGTINNDEIDFGDAPTAAQSGFAGTYPTLLGNNGARHSTVLGFQLGSTIDGEDDGQPNATSTGDGSDEDGVTLPGILVTGTNANITVNSSATGKLDAWVDFNQDGDFADAGEQIFTSQNLVAGNNNLSFVVPGGATTGSSFARFRLSTAGGLSYNGLAADGEVEDYQVSIVSNQISITSPTITEGNASTTPMVYTISRTVNSNASSVDYAITGGTATSGTDYTPIASGTINFAIGGALSQDITVNVNGDIVVENNETVIITLSNAVNGGIGTGTGTGTINNDDSATLSLSGGIAQAEGAGYTFQATLSAPVQGGFTVSYNTNDGTATISDNDYNDNDGTLTFTGSANEVQTFLVNSVPDNKVELNETFTATLGVITSTSAVQIAAITKLGSPQTATINNDDGATVLLVADITQSESISPQSFSVSLSNPVDVPVTVQFSTTNNTATTTDNDFVGITNQLVTFPAGTTASQTVPVSINNDNKVEDNELYNVNIHNLQASGRNVTISTNTRTGFITNDDAATLTLSGGISQNEGNTGTTAYVFTATLNNPVQGGFTMPFSTNDGTATSADNDYIDNDGLIGFSGTPGEIKTITVLVNGDHKVEANETFAESIGILSGNGSVQLAAITTVGSPQTATVTNDEVDFGDAPDTYGTLLSSNGARHSTVLGFRLGTAIDGEDDGQPNGTATGDGSDEDGVSLPPVLITNVTANIVVNASSAGKLDAWVDYNNNGNFSDAGEKVLNNVTLVAGNNNLSFLVPSGATPSNTFSRFRFSSTGGLSATGLASDGEVEDYAIQIVNTQFSISDPIVTEGNAGTSNLVYTITRTNNASACSVDYAITGGTATTADNDYVALAAGTASFTTGGVLTKDITVSVNGDSKVELDETVIMTLSNAVNSVIQKANGTGTITNDDAAIITITSPSINEPDVAPVNLVFDISMSNQSDANVSFNYASADGTATIANNDYTLTSGSHTLSPGQSTKQILVPIIGDCVIEPNEIFSIILSSLNNAGRAITFSGGGANLTGTGTILNEDAPPVITFCPPNVTISCDQSSAPANTGTATATDDCPAAPVITFTDAITNGNCINNYIITRTWKATDGTNDMTTCSQTITVRDITPPTLTCPPNVTVSCVEQVPAPNIATVTNVSDNCSGVVTVSFVNDLTIPGSCVNRYSVIRTYRATDVCGNSATCTQTIIVNDNTAPTIVCPAAVTVSCASQVPAINTASVIASDNCSGGAPIVTFVSDVIVNQSCANRYTINRTYKATDVCGNSATCLQVITVNDVAPPSISCPAAVSVSCASQVPSVNTASVVTSDNCGGGAPVVTFVSDVTVNLSCANRFTINRTYRSTDVCGNSATCLQVITVNDIIAPTITCPANLTVSCSTQVPAPNTASVIATDNCSGGTPTVTFVNDVINNQTCLNNYSITRTYRATDVCGNTATCTQTITVNDQIAPVISGVPADITIQCTQPVPVNPTVTATDNCSGTVTLSYTESNTQSPWPQLCEYYNYSITRIWVATDACGNSSTKVWKIKVQDTQGPQWKFVPPAFLTVECDDDNSNNLDPIPGDACDGTPSTILEVKYKFGIYNCINNYLATYTWTAGDKCGNTIQYVQQITVVDTTGPEMLCPANIVINSTLPTPVKWPSPKAGDYCDGQTNVVQIAGPPSGSIFQPNTVTTIIYQSTDECGNKTTCSFTVTIKSKGGASNQSKISGNIKNIKAVPIENVQVNMTGDINQFNLSNGAFEFVDLPNGSNIELIPVKTDNPLNGVNTLDMVYISNHILGKKALDSPYKLLAADVNNSKSITTADLVQLRKLILHIIDKFEAADSWKFLQTDLGFNNPTNPWIDPLPGSYKISNLQKDQILDFTAIKMGDVNGDATAKLNGNIKLKNGQIHSLQADDRLFSKNEEVELLLSTKDINNLKALQFTLEFDPTKLIYIGVKSLNDKISEENFGLRYLEQGNITGSIDLTQLSGTDLCILKFKAIEAGELSKFVRLSSTLTPAEAYTKEDETIGLNLVFKQDEKLIDIKVPKLYQNEPNPFENFTSIKFVLPENQEASLSIFDLNGKLIKEIKDNYKKGEHVINFNKEDFLSSGIYYYQLKTNEFTDTKKMMFIK